MATPAGTIDISARFDSSGLERDVLAALRRIETKSTISLNTRNFTQPLGKITGLANEFNKSLEASNARVVAFGASAGIIFNIQKAFSSLIKSTIEVEKSLTDINVVLGLSTKGIASFGDQLFDVAKNTGSAFQEVTSAAVEFSRQGLGLEQTLKRTRDALILTRLSGLDVVSSTEALTSAVNSFTKEALTTTDVVNKLAAVDARFAVSSADLSEAIKRVGSSASEAGVSFDELLGIVTSVQQTTARGGAVIGNALKTIFTRIERPEVINDLREFGIAVNDASGNVLPTIKVIENLAQSFQNLNPVVKSQVAELVGGVYQINILKAALADVSKENSVFASATSTASKAVDEAILKNEALNKSLSALLNSTTANLTQLASKIGGVSVAPAVRKVLGTINDELTDINDKPAESVGAKIASGLLAGLTNFITGPGIGIGTLVVGKLLGNFTKFATDATKNFLGLNTVGQQQKVIQDETANILARNPQLIQGIISGSKSRLQVEKEIKQILMEQAALSEQIALSSRGMAERMVATGLSVTSTGGLRRSAGGFIPAKDRAAEVMGAAAGGYVAGNVIKAPDSIGGIMNSAESVKYVPGFAQPFILPPKGSKAASNLRNKSLRQVGIDPYLAKGFIPNFASEDQTLRQKNPQTMGPTLEGWLNLLKAKKSNPPKYFIENYEPNMTAAQFFEKVASEKLAQNSLATHLESFGLPKDEVKRIVNQSITTAGQTAEFGGKGRATLFAQTQKELGALKTYVPNAEMLVWRSEAAGPYYTNPSIAQAPRGNVVPVSFKVVPLDQTKISAEKVDIQEKSRNLSFNLLEEFAKSLPLSSEGQAAIAGSKISEYGERTPLAYRQLAGTIFEAGINLVSDYVRDAKNADQGDFDIRGGANIGNLRNFFPSFTSNLGDYKLSDTEDNKNSFLKKIWQEFKKPIGDQYLAETSRIATQTKPEYVNLEVDRRIQEAGSIMAALEKTEGKRAVSAANVPNKFSAGFIPNFLPTNFLKPYRKNLNRIRRGEFNFLPDMRQYMSMGIPMSYYAPAGMTLTDNDTVFINDKLNRKQGSNILAHEMGHSMISNVEGLREKLKTIKFDQEEIKLLQKIKYLPTQEETGMDAYATNQLAEETIVDPDRLKALASSKEFDSISKKFGLSKKQVQTLLLLSKRYQKAGFSNLKRTGSSYYGNYFLKKIISPDSYANNANVPRKTFNPWLNSGFIPNFSTTNQQTSSPEFKRWFENSKIVNEQGEPLRVYHGTNASFTTFRQAKEGTYGKGIYVTPDLEMASSYTTESALGERRGQGGNIMPLYTSLKNPIDVVDKDGLGPLEVLKKLGYTSDKASNVWEKALESRGNLTTQIQKRAELYGHDGIIARYPDGRIKEIVVFYPGQVKSSIGNKGTFDPINPDIRYANGFIPNFAKRDKYKFPKISSAKMEANISKNFEKLSPENRKYFARAYEDYNNLIKVFSKVSGTSPEKFANVMSALSPANPLERNALDALRYNLFAQKKLSKVVSPVFLDEREIGSVKAQTYGANRTKAARLIVGLEKLTGNKRKAFLNNMLDPFGSPDVTVDYRAQGDALNKKFNVKNAPTMNREQYDKVSQAFRNVGIRAGVSGLGVQAATWIGQRMNTKAARGQDFNRGILKFFFDNPDKINLENLEFLLNVPGRGKAKADFFKKASAMGVSKLGSDSLISISRSKGFIPNFTPEQLSFNLSDDNALSIGTRSPVSAKANKVIKIAETSGSDLSITPDGTLKVDFLRSKSANPLFSILKAIKKGLIKKIDAGAVIGPRVPNLITGLKNVLPDLRKNNPLIPSSIPIEGSFSPKDLIRNLYRNKAEFEYSFDEDSITQVNKYLISKGFEIKKGSVNPNHNFSLINKKDNKPSDFYSPSDRIYLPESFSMDSYTVKKLMSIPGINLNIRKKRMASSYLYNREDLSKLRKAFEEMGVLGASKQGKTVWENITHHSFGDYAKLEQIYPNGLSKGFIPNFNSSADIQKYLADFDSRTVSEFSNKNIRGGTGMSVLLERLKFVKGLLNINPNLTAKELIEILNDRKAKGNNINFTGQSKRFTREDALRLIARVKNNRDDLGMSSGFIPNFANYTDSVMQLERNLSGSTAILDTTTGPYPFIRNSKQANFADAVADHGGVANALKDSMQMQTSAGLLKNKGFIPNFADFGTTDTVILFSSLTLLASQVKNLVVDFRQLSDATKKAVQNQKDITAASTANISKINKQFKTTEASIQKQASIFANINKNLKTASKAPLEVFDPASPSGRRLATADEIKQLEELRAQRSQAKSQKTQGIARERQSIQEAQQSAQNALKNRFGRYATTLGPTAGIVGSQLANVVGSFLPESDIKGKAVASGIGDIASFAGTGAAFGVPGLIVGTAAGIATAFIKIKDAKADQAIFDIGKSLDQIKTKSAEFSGSAQGYAVSLEELQRALNDPQSRPEALSRFQKNLSDSLAAIPAEFRDKVFRAGTDLNKVTQAITDINKELSNTQRNLERELSIATLFKEKTTFLNKIGLSNFGLNEKDQKILERLFASSLNQQEVLKNFSNAAPGQDFETFINDLASQAVSVRNLATAPIGGTVGFTPLNQAQTTTQQFLDPARLEQIKSELSRRGVLTEGVAGQLDTAFEKGNIELVRSIFKTIAEEGKSLIEAEKRTRLLVEIQKENINRIKDNEQALKNLNKQYNNLNLLLSNQIDLEKNRASTIREINLIQSEGKVSIQRARTKGLLDASAPFITEQQRLDIQGQLDINEITTRGNARIQQAANELLDSFTNILVTQSQDARQEIVGLVSDPTTRPQDITRQRNVFQQTIQKLNPLITQSLRDINSGKNIKDIQTDLIGQIRNFAEFSPEQQDVLIQSIESSGSKLENQLGLILAETNRDLAIQQAQLEAQKQTLDLTRKLSFAGGAQALATTGEAGISQLYDNLSQLVSEFRKTNAIGTVAQRGSTSFKLLDVLTNQLQLNRATQAPTPFESADAFNNQVSSDLTNLTAVSIAGRVQQIRKSLNLAQRLTEIQTGQPTAGTALGRAFETAGQEAITTAMDQITAEFKLGNMGTYLDALQNEARYLNTLTQQQNDLLAKTLPDNLNQNFQKVITSQVGSKLDDLTTALRTTINSLATQTQKGVLETEQSNLLPIAAPDVRKQILERVLNQTGLKETPPAVSVTSQTDPEKIKKFNEEMADLNEYINSLAILKVNPNTINSEDFRSVNLVKLNATIEEQKKAIDTQVRVRNKYPNYFTGAKDAVNERLIEIRSLQKPAEEQVNKVTDLTGTYEGFVRSLNEEFGGRLLKGQEITVEQIKSLQANQKAMQELLQNPLQIMNVPTATNAYGPVEGAYAYGPNVVPAAQNQAGELNREIPDYLKTSRAATDRINQVLVARASITKDMSAVQEKVNKLLQQQTLDAEQQAELLKLQVELRKDVIEQDAKAADYLYNLYYSKDNRAFSDTFFREEKAAFADAEIRSQARSGNLALGAITQKNLEYTRIDFVKDTAEMIDEFQVNFKSGIGSAFGEAIKGTKSLQDAFRDMFQNLLNRMLDKSLQMGVDSLFAFGKAAAGFKNGGEIKKYNSGGMVTGGSGNKDDVLTMMRGGEFVIKKSSVNKYGSSYLEALNQQTIPTAADGGFAVGPLQNEFLYLNTPERPTSGEYAVDSRLSAMALTDENNPQNRLREQRFEELDRYLQDRAQFERDKDQAMKMYEKQVRSTFYSGLIAAGTQLASAGLNVGAQNLRLPKTGTTGIGKQYQAYSPDMPNYVGGKANGGFIPLKGFANGGMSSGGMPALLMGGEYVMNRDAVKNYGTDFMSRLNSGTLPRYAQGGSIGGSYTTSQTGPQSQSNSVDDLVTALNTLNENLTKTSNITQSEAGKAIGTVSQESGMSVVNNISISMTPAGEVNSQVQSNTTQGTTTSQNDQNSAQNNAKLAEILRAKVVEVLVEQKRPGGLLYRS